MFARLIPGGPLYNLFAALTVAAAVTVGVMGVERGLASGESSGPEPWPQGTHIRYFNDSPWQRTVDRAARKWNETGLDVKLVRAGRRQHADVVVVADSAAVKRDGCGSCAARVTSIGRGDGEQIIMYLPDFTADDQDMPPAVANIRLVSHEFGHILGLTHPAEGCAVMRPDTGSDSCTARQLADPDPRRAGGACGLLPVDLHRLRRWYGPVSRTYSPYCEFSASERLRTLLAAQPARLSATPR